MSVKSPSLRGEVACKVIQLAVAKTGCREEFESFSVCF